MARVFLNNKTIILFTGQAAIILANRPYDIHFTKTTIRNNYQLAYFTQRLANKCIERLELQAERVDDRKTLIKLGIKY